MSQSDSAADKRAAEAVVRHHAQLAEALQSRTRDLIDAVDDGDLAQMLQRREALVSWLHAELLPHAQAEEAKLYPAAAARPEGKLLIDGMLNEHKVIMRLVTELTDATSPVGAAATAWALAVVFDLHLAKENDLVVPLLVSAEDVSVAELLEGMHDLIGGHGEQEKQSSGGCGCGGCGCGGDAPGATSAEAPVLSIDTRLDVRTLPHGPQRHAAVLNALESVPPSGALVLVAPHAPRPLLAEIEARFTGQFDVEWLQSGPDVWQIRLRRVASA